MMPIEVDDFLRKAAFFSRVIFLGPYEFKILTDGKGELVGEELCAEHLKGLNPKGIRTFCRLEMTRIQIVNGWYPRANAIKIINTDCKVCPRTGKEYAVTRFQPMRIEN